MERKVTRRRVPVVEIRAERVRTIQYLDREINNPREAAELGREIIAEEIATYDREHFVALYLNTKNRPVGYQVISVGTLTAALVHPREVFKGALLCNAYAVIIAHNHPSGDPTPSKEDKEITRRLKEAGQVLGIDILDHLVIGHNGRYTSFRERGIL